MATPYTNEAAQFIHDNMKGKPPWWEALIDGYLRERDRCAKPYWDLARECYEQEQFTGYHLRDRYTLDQVQPPRVYGLVHQIESQVFNRNPKFFVSPMTPKQEGLAQFAEGALNTEWLRDARLQRETRLALRDCILTGWGWILSGVEGDHDAMRRQRLKRQKLARALTGDPMKQEIVGQLAAQAEMQRDSIAMEDTRTNFELDDRVWEGRVCSRRVSPDDVVVDPNATCLEDARWVGRIIYADYDAVMHDDRFRNKSRLQPTTVMAGASERNYRRQNPFINPSKSAAVVAGPGDVPLEYQYVELFEIFERQPDGSWDMKVFAKGHDKFLREEKAPYDLGCPYKLLRWNDIGQRIFSVSDIQPVLTHVIEEREIRTRLHDAYMRAAVDVYAFDRSLLSTEEDIRPLTMEGIGLMLPLNGMTGRPIDQVVRLLPRNPQTQEALAYLSIIERNIQEGTGLGANQQLQALKSETSATEAAEIARHASARGAAKYSAFNEFVANVAHDRLKLAAQFYDAGMIATLAGPEAAAMWMGEEFTRADIQWGLNVSVEVGSMQPKNDQSRAQAVTTAIQIAKSDPVAAQMLNLPRLWEEFFKLLGFQKGSEFLQGMDPNMMSQMYMQMAMMGQQPGQGATGAAAPAQASSDAGMAQMGGGELG